MEHIHIEIYKSHFEYYLVFGYMYKTLHFLHIPSKGSIGKKQPFLCDSRFFVKHCKICTCWPVSRFVGSDRGLYVLMRYYRSAAATTFLIFTHPCAIGPQQFLQITTTWSIQLRAHSGDTLGTLWRYTGHTQRALTSHAERTHVPRRLKDGMKLQYLENP